MFLAPAGRSELVVPAARADFTLQVRAVRAGVAHGVTSESKGKFFDISSIFQTKKQNIFDIIS